MAERTERLYSATRTKATWKPRVVDVDPPLFHCSKCGSILLGVAGNKPATFSGTGRTLVGEPPYSQMNSTPSCCGQSMSSLTSIPAEHLPDDINIDYTIIGGYNNNSIKLTWDIKRPECTLTWVALKTFTGIQVSYLMPQKRSPLIFALAAEDAYVYCDEDPCLGCIFMCKRGFVVMAYVENLGLVRMPLERAEATGSRK